jgi:hypothetical protein
MQIQNVNKNSIEFTKKLTKFNSTCIRCSFISQFKFSIDKSKINYKTHLHTKLDS